MKKYTSAFSGAANKIGSAAKKTVDEYAKKRIPDEPAFTCALVARIHDCLDNYSKGGIHWTAKVLTSHGKGTQEKIFGADFLGSLSLDLPGFQQNKGFLAQAKCQEPGTRLANADWQRLQDRTLGVRVQF